MNDKILNQLKKLHKSLANKEKSLAMSAYMRNQFKFLGIATPIRQEAIKPIIKTIASKKDALELVVALWALPEREYQYTAYSILKHFQKELTPEDAPLLERLITDKSWWDTVDGLAPMYGALALKYPTLYTQLDSYVNHSNIWLNRTAIIHQLYYNKSTDAARLCRYIQAHLETKEFFVQKAIGWSLRQYAKHYPLATIEFVEKTKLSKLATSQAYRHLKKNKDYTHLIKK